MNNNHEPNNKNCVGTKQQLQFLRKGDMNFWLVMLVIALIFMVIVFFVMNSVFQKWGETTGGVQGQVDKELKDKNIFEGINGNDEGSSEGTTPSDTK